jgi:serine protease Do
MRTIASVLITLLGVLPGSPAQAQGKAASLTAFSNSIQELSSRISPSVVQIIATGYGLESDTQQVGASVLSRERSTGSGVIVSDEGYIMTNAHVVQGARSIRIKLNDPSKRPNPLLEGKLIGMDRQLDLAMVKVEASGLHALPFGNSADLKQGEVVLAFGSPLGMDNSVTMGIVSAVARQLSEDDPRIFIQTDAPINPGNSGGPLVDSLGHLVGINTFIFTQSGGSEGLGFAIPSNVIRYVYASLKRDGHVHRGHIGISARTITPALASVFHLEPDSGVLLEDVAPDGPAEKAGLQVGDVILSLGSKPLRNVRDLALQLYQFGIGDTVPLQILRNQKTIAATVSVTEVDDDPERFADLVNPEDNFIAKLAILGVTVDDNLRKLVSSLRMPDGVLVAGQSGVSQYFGDPLREGDIIHAVNGRHIPSVDALRLALTNLTAEEPLVLHIEREGALMFVVLERI